MRQPPSQDPNDPTGQPLPYSPPEQSFAPPPPSSSSPGYIVPANPPSYSGEEHFYNQTPQVGGQVVPYQSGQGTLVPQPPKRPNGWRTATLVLLVITLVLAGTTALLLTHTFSSNSGGVTSTSTATPIGQPTSAPPNQTPGAAPTKPASTGETPTVATPNSNDYSAAQPGPGCDTNGGTWTPQGIGNITCGTTVTPATNALGYLYLQLPNNEAFSPKNKISVIGSPSSTFFNQCIGLAEQDANTGFLVQYCSNGAWSISSISSKGAIIQTLANSVTSTRATANISLTLDGSTLSFAIDTEMHQINITPIQPIKVAIAYLSNYGGITTNNFSYTVLSS